MATLLLIEDSPVERAQLAAALRDTGLFDRILEGEDGIDGIRLLLSEPVDLVLCDLEMPRAGGDKVLVMKNSMEGRADVPFVVLTGSQDFERSARLLRQGASDVIGKPFHAADLVARLDLHLRMVEIQRGLRRRVELLEHLSTTDPLTGLRNRRFLSESLALEFHRAERHGTVLSVVLGDIDGFKQLNLDQGHEAGDAVLRGSAEVLRKNLRSCDVGGRFGGDEFLSLLAHTNAEGASVFAERWRRDVAATGSPGAPEATLSVGVASYARALDGPAALLSSAEQALLQARQAGGNQVVVAAP